MIQGKQIKAGKKQTSVKFVANDLVEALTNNKQLTERKGQSKIIEQEATDKREV